MVVFTLIAATSFALPIDNPLGKGKTFNSIVENIVKWANAIAIPLTSLMILVAGYFFVTGGGSKDQIEKGKRALLWAVVGFAVILFSQVVHLIIKSVLGA